MTLVLLPGLDGTGHLFQAFIAALGPQVRTVVVCYPPDQALDYTGLEAIARTFLPANEPYHLLAESFSGPIGISIAASAPPGLRGLILSCTFARNPLPWLAFARPLIGLAPIRSLPMAVLSHFLLGRFDTTTQCAALKQALGGVSPRALRARAKAALSANVSADLEKVHVPILYLRASEDKLIPAACARLISSLAPAAKIETIQAPHFLLQTAPSAAIAAIMAWTKAG